MKDVLGGFLDEIALGSDGWVKLGLGFRVEVNVMILVLLNGQEYWLWFEGEIWWGKVWLIERI